MKFITLITSATLAATPALAADSEDDYTSYQDIHRTIREVIVLSTDCGQGINKAIVIDNGASVVWSVPNTARWCNPIGQTLNPVDDPVFQSGG